MMTILNHSDEYQIFFTVSDVDDKGTPYDVMDCRGKWTYDPKSKDPLKKGTVDPTPIKAAAFANATTWKQRAELSSKLFEYTYRDTWTHGVMGMVHANCSTSVCSHRSTSRLWTMPSLPTTKTAWA